MADAELLRRAEQCDVADGTSATDEAARDTPGTKKLMEALRVGATGEDLLHIFLNHPLEYIPIAARLQELTGCGNAAVTQALAALKEFHYVHEQNVLLYGVPDLIGESGSEGPWMYYSKKTKLLFGAGAMSGQFDGKSLTGQADLGRNNRLDLTLRHNEQSVGVSHHQSGHSIYGKVGSIGARAGVSMQNEAGAGRIEAGVNRDGARVLSASWQSHYSKVILAFEAIKDREGKAAASLSAKIPLR